MMIEQEGDVTALSLSSHAFYSGIPSFTLASMLQHSAHATV
jgi:hypothetical protein